MIWGFFDEPKNKPFNVHFILLPWNVSRWNSASILKSHPILHPSHPIFGIKMHCWGLPTLSFSVFPNAMGTDNSRSPSVWYTGLLNTIHPSPGWNHCHSRNLSPLHLFSSPTAIFPSLVKFSGPPNSRKSLAQYVNDLLILQLLQIQFLLKNSKMLLF